MKKTLPIITCLTLALAAGQAGAQISTDATLGREPQELQGPNYAIGSDLGRIRGQNLFHSFERFSLDTDESATFSGPDAIRNVISRVTGGERSEIDGTIASTIDGADFYFINPAGVLFGPNASLDVPGSVHVATANELRFADGAAFSASEPAASTLTVASPEAFGFLDRGAGSITLDRTQELLVAPDRSLSLVGGDVVIDRGLIALRDLTRNGNVTLVALSRPGSVAVADGSTSAAPQGEISITDGAIDVSSEAGGGVVRIRAGALVLDGFDAGVIADNLGGEPGIATALIDIEADRVELDGAAVGSVALGAGDGGEVEVRAGELTVLNDGLLITGTDGAGNAGDLTISAREFAVLNGATVGSDTGLSGSGTGDAGDVTVSTRELEIASGGLIRSTTSLAGNAGRILISADQVTIHSARPDLPTGITTAQAGIGDAGEVRVEAEEITVRDSGFIFSNSFDRGDAGRVELSADRINLLTGGQIGSGTAEDLDFGLQSTGNGGNVVVTATEAIVISGQSSVVDPRTDAFPPSGIFVSTESTSPDAGDAGTATVTAPLIMIADRGEIASETFNPADGGTLLVSADHLVIDNGEITTQATRAGNGGRVEVAANVIELRNGGLITAESTGSGNAGSLTIRAPDRLVLDDRSEISTSAVEAGGGQITIEVDRLIDLRKSLISSSVAREAGNAGDITIDPDFLVLDDSAILARADAGVGGDISIVADNLVVSPDSLINAEAGEEGIDGTVATSEPAVDLASALVVLAAPPLDADALLREPCALRQDVGTSSFTGVGRGGLPAAPDRPLGSAYRSAAEGGAAPGTNVRPAALTLAMHCSSTD